MTSNFVDDKESEENIKLQNENAQLNLELCTLHTQCESLELENKSLKEEILSLQEKIKNFEEYIDKIEENDIIENTQINENSLSILKEENDPNILKHKIVELQKEIIRLSDNIKEDLINNENMKTEYENQIEVLKNDIIALENENDQMRIDVNKIKDKCQIDVKNCYEEIAIIRKEKEEAEQKFIEKLKELNQIIKTYQNKILEQEKAYKDLCDSSSKKLKETYDKFTSEIKNLKNNQIDNFSMNEMSLEIHNLKTENIEIKNKLEKSQLELSETQKELKELSVRNSSFNIIEKNLKNKIKELEEKNENLRAEILNSSMNENDVVKEEKKNEKIIKDNIQIKEENEKLKRYIISSEFRNAYAIKIIFQYRKLKDEIEMYKKEIEELKNI
jgi:chromosome segregation ATPase